MSIKIGTADVTDIKIGTTNVNHVYIGSTLIWQRASATTYELVYELTYSAGSYILASGTRTAELKTYIRTLVGGVEQSKVLTDMSTINVYSQPTGCDFSISRTSAGTYTISAASRGEVVNAYTDASIYIAYATHGLSDYVTVSQEANAITDTAYDDDVVFDVSSDYVSSYSPCPASGDTWTVSATATYYEYEQYTYTSTAVSEWQTVDYIDVSSNISFDTTGDGLSNSGTSITYDTRGAITGAVRSGTIDVSVVVGADTYYGEKTIYQQANALGSLSYVIDYLKLNGVDANLTGVAYSGASVSVSSSGTVTGEYTSGAPYSSTFSPTNSESETWLSISGGTITVSSNSGVERTGTVTASYSGATSINRTITQNEYVSVVAPSVSLGTAVVTGSHVTMKASVTDDGGSTVTAIGFEWGYTASYEQGTLYVTPVVQSGEFTKQIGAFLPSTTVYFKAFATNSAGTTYTSGTSETTTAGKTVTVELGTIMVSLVQYPAVKLTNTTDSTDITDLVGSITIDWAASVVSNDIPPTVYLNDSGEGVISLASTTPDIDGGTYAVYKLGVNGTNKFTDFSTARQVSGTSEQTAISGNNVEFGTIEGASAAVSESWTYLFT